MRGVRVRVLVAPQTQTDSIERRHGPDGVEHKLLIDDVGYAIWIGMGPQCRDVLYYKTVEVDHKDRLARIVAQVQGTFCGALLNRHRPPLLVFSSPFLRASAMLPLSYGHNQPNMPPVNSAYTSASKTDRNVAPHLRPYQMEPCSKAKP